MGIMVKTLDFSSHLLPDYQKSGLERNNAEYERLVLQEVMKYDFSEGRTGLRSSEILQSSEQTTRFPKVPLRLSKKRNES